MIHVHKCSKGGVFPMAAPYTLVVPTQYLEAMNLSLPAVSWALGLRVALPSMKLAYDNVSGYEPMSLEKGGEQLDQFRRVHRLTMALSSEY